MDILQMEFVRFALISSELIGVICSYIGVFVVLKRIIFVGIALAQISALGVATAVYLEKDPTLYAFLFTIVGVIILAPNYGGKRFPPEAILGICFAASWAFAILLLSKAAHGEASMLDLVRGNILGTTDKDIRSLLIIFIPSIIIYLVFYKQFLFALYDHEMADTLGMNSKLWIFIFYLLLGLVVSVSIKTAGVLLTFTLLIIPAVTALSIGNSLKSCILISILFSLLACILGCIYSVKLDFPTGPAIAACCFLIFIIANIIKFTIKKALTIFQLDRAVGD